MLDFDDIHDQYQRRIHSYLLRMTQDGGVAEDLTQETFIRAHRGLSSFRGDAGVSTWLYRIATNVSIDHLRSRGAGQAKSTLSLDDMEGVDTTADDEAPSPELQASQSEMSECVREFIDRLPPDYRSALLLSDVQGLKAREIAEILDCSLPTVKIRLHRARKKLREALGAGCDFSHDERNVFVCERKEEDENTPECS